MNDQHSNTRGALAETFRVLRERFWLILACTIFVTSTAFAYASTRPASYEATSQILLNPDNVADSIVGVDGGQMLDPEREAATALELLRQRAVAAGVGRQLRPPRTAEQVLDAVSAAAVGNSRVLAVTATSESPEQAASIARLYSSAYVDFREQAERAGIERAMRAVDLELQSARAANDADRERDLAFRMSQLEILLSVTTGGAQVIEQATVPTTAVSPKPLRSGLIGLVVGLVLGAGLALLRDRTDPRIKTEEEIDRYLPGLPLLARIPSWRLQRTTIQQSEGFRALRTTLALWDPDNSIRSILITSSTMGEGKTTTSLNLALAISERDESVILIEGDLRRRGLTRRLGLDEAAGVTEILQGEGDPEEYLNAVAVDEQKPRRGGDGGVATAALPGTVHVVPGGLASENPHTLLARPHLRDLLTATTRMADYVVVDGTPMGLLTDSLPVAARVDAVIVVVHLFYTRRKELRRLADQLRSSGVEPLGMVVFGDRSESAYDAYLQ